MYCKRRQQLEKLRVCKAKGWIFSEKYWHYFHCPKNVLCSILSFVFWIFPPLDTAVQLESADSKQNAISKSLYQDGFWHIFLAMRKMHLTFWKKATFIKLKMSKERWASLFFLSSLPARFSGLCSKQQKNVYLHG